MIKYNPNLHHRRSVRLRRYDYSQAGLYFVTICTQDRKCLFGEIINGQVRLNEYGQMAYDEWLKTPTIRPNVQLGEFVVMPDHIHGIIAITENIGFHGRGVLHTPLLENATNDIEGVCNTPLRSPSQTVGA
ncbi:MAG: transposase, partial [Bacteroidales bacterium]|nr:transposase [Bacteroidales bacterium]